MRPLNKFVPFACAAVVFAAGYAYAAGNDGDPSRKAKWVSPDTVSFAEGPDAAPPPWPADAMQQVPQRRPVVQALNIPSSALSSVAHPPPSVADQPATDHAVTASSADTDRVSRHLRPRRLVMNEVTFATTSAGQHMTIIWDHH